MPACHELVDPLRHGRHVGALAHDVDAAGEQVRGVLGVDLVLRGAREGAVRGDRPQRVVVLRDVGRHELDAREPLGVLADPSAPDGLQLDHERQLLPVDAVLVVDHAAGIRQRHRFRAEVEQLLHRVLRDVAGARHQALLALERLGPRAEHLLGEVDGAVPRRLGPDQRAAPAQSLPREHAGELVADPLVLPEQVADLAPAHADVAGRHVRVLPDVALELGHERLTEPHDLALALALRVEVGAALAGAEGQGGQRVLERLLEREELQHPEVDRRVEAKAALVGADRARHLDAEPAFDLDLAPVVHPRDAEDDHAFGLEHPLEDLRVAVAGVPLQGQFDGPGDLLDGLMEFRFARVLGHQLRHEPVHVLAHAGRSIRPGSGSGGTAATVVDVPMWVAIPTAILLAYVIWRVGMATLRSLAGPAPGSLDEEPPPCRAGGRGRPRGLPRLFGVRHRVQGLPPGRAPDPSALRREDAGRAEDGGGLIIRS